MEAAPYHLDELDYDIIESLRDDAQRPFSDIAHELGVSAGTIHARFAKLRKSGIISGSKLVLDPEKLGLDVHAFVGVNLNSQRDYDKVVDKLRDIPEVCDIFSVTGEVAIIARVRTRSIGTLRNVIQSFQNIKEISSTHTSMILHTPLQRDVTAKTIRSAQRRENPWSSD